MIKTAVKAILAGLFIGIGGIVYLSCSNPTVGAFLFGIGLFVIVSQQYALFTGAIGYAWKKSWKQQIEFPIIWIGNWIGTAIAAWGIRLSRHQALLVKAESLVQVKLNDTALSIFFLSFFCGILMYIAVDSFKTQEKPFVQCGMIFLCVTVFILSGFEHCIANMFYFHLAGSWSRKAWVYLLIMTIGNSVGALGVSGLKQLLFEKK